jgi:hypothetical protein
MARPLCYRGLAICFLSGVIRLPIKKSAAERRCIHDRGSKLKMASGNGPSNGPGSDSRISRQSKVAAASGWIGSALEYYDFFIYATAASLVFPQIFFPSQNPTTAIVASLATYGVGYVARPIGAFVLGHWGDTMDGKASCYFACF